MRHWFSVIAILTCLACGRESTPPKPEKDLVNFTLPVSVSEAAPHMQDHLYRVILYNSSRFMVKPNMVFLDGTVPTMGKLDPMVMRLNLLHLAYWEGEQLIWSGSLMHPVAKGAHAFSKSGLEVSLRHRDGTMAFLFGDGDLRLTHEFPADTDHEAWLGTGKKRLYLNAYVFPDALVNGDPELREAERDQMIERLEQRQRERAREGGND